MINVLHIIKSLGRGGAEKLLVETLEQHNKKAYNFHYAYFLPWKDALVKELEAAGGKVTCFSAKNNIALFTKVFRLAAYVRENDIKLIHCHLPWSGIIGRLVGKLTKIPVVYTEHNIWERYQRVTYLFNKYTFGAQQKVIAVSNEVALSIQKNWKHDRPAVEVVNNGVDTQKFCNLLEQGRDIRKELLIPANAVVIGATCVFRKQKRLLAWLEVASELHKKFPGTYFILIGDGVLHDEVHKKAGELGMQRYLHFAGLQTEVRPYLKAINVFMMSSEFEGLPIALLEAMSMGCMPACTAAGGIPQVIIHNKNGLLVPVGEPYKLAEVLCKYLENPSSITCVGTEARRTIVSSFSIKKMVADIEQIYKNLTQ
ncbi:MAG TPA: glycosyltransferase [Chitinophagaceae bacterium]|nr:glycosyltransferase [Chitinophagaceae bacterium]